MTKRVVLILVMLLETNNYSYPSPVSTYAVAIFAGGCFWCMEHDFEQVPGVVEVVSGYTGGKVVKPTYQQVSTGKTGHVESIKVTYNPSQISFKKLVDFFWLQIDPTNGNGQFCDTGNQYRSMLFYQNPDEKKILENSIKNLMQTKPFSGPIQTTIHPVSTFYPAEPEHQNYYLKHPWLYKFYRYSCRRDKRLNELWGNNTIE